MKTLILAHISSKILILETNFNNKISSNSLVIVLSTKYLFTPKGERYQNG